MLSGTVAIDREVLESVVACARDGIMLRPTSPIVMLIEAALSKCAHGKSVDGEVCGDCEKESRV